MTSKYQKLQTGLTNNSSTWLITGVAGFIGSNLLETLLKLNQRVIGLDNFATGYQHNLDEVRGEVTPDQWASFTFIEGDIRRLESSGLAVHSRCGERHSPAGSLRDPLLALDWPGICKCGDSHPVRGLLGAGAVQYVVDSERATA